MNIILVFVTRMDSIDVYLEKKRKRVEMFNQSAKRAKVIRINPMIFDTELRLMLVQKTGSDFVIFASCVPDA